MRYVCGALCSTVIMLDCTKSVRTRMQTDDVIRCVVVCWKGFAVGAHWVRNTDTKYTHQMVAHSTPPPRGYKTTAQQHIFAHTETRICETTFHTTCVCALCASEHARAFGAHPHTVRRCLRCHAIKTIHFAMQIFQFYSKAFGVRVRVCAPNAREIHCMCVVPFARAIQQIALLLLIQMLVSIFYDRRHLSEKMCILQYSFAVRCLLQSSS